VSAQHITVKLKMKNFKKKVTVDKLIIALKNKQNSSIQVFCDSDF